ncbi:hypothetical protein [Mesorhizobium sp. ORS 3428]|uniref:hypothetical protein n=1 Tax=Mesorhizobium sp. ORS 3428 TaxID=540997 RepID=UPI001042647D|nr:hypothetical protein [Mesorhizobium sp. ORS 3428]
MFSPGDMIRERAVSKVAPEFGISDVALRKKCVNPAIPSPDATYWDGCMPGARSSANHWASRQRV